MLLSQEKRSLQRGTGGWGGAGRWGGLWPTGVGTGPGKEVMARRSQAVLWCLASEGMPGLRNLRE